MSITTKECKKCGHYTHSGPHYVADKDRLKYRCTRCGHVTYELPNDSKGRTPNQMKWARQRALEGGDEERADQYQAVLEGMD